MRTLKILITGALTLLSASSGHAFGGHRPEPVTVQPVPIRIIPSGTLVQLPVAGSTVSSPVHIVATSQDPAVLNLQVWEGPTKYGFQVGSSLNQNYSMTPGAHNLIVISVGKANLVLSKALVSIMVAPTISPTPSPSPSRTITLNLIPTPPADAVVLENLNQLPKSAWHNPCTGPCSACPPGDQSCDAANANYNWGQTTSPMLDSLGDFFELASGPTIAKGTPWPSVVFGLSLASMDPRKQDFTWATHFIEDFQFQINNENPQALEFDFWQAIGGTKYMFGNQCVFPSHEWDGWNEVTGHWVKSAAPCPVITANGWHHVVMYVERANGNTVYHAIQIDGTSYATSLTEPGAPNSGWGNSIGVQFQLDYNYSLGNPAPGYMEFLDKLSVTAW